MSTQEALRKRREQVIDELSDAFADDAIEMAEFERRLALAHRAEEVTALETTVSDLPKRTLGPSTALATVTSTTVAPTRQLPAVVPKERSVIAVLGSITRGGAWSVPRLVKVNSVFGSAVLDLREATLGPGLTEMKLRAVFGSIEILVPPHLAVEVDGVAVLGSFDHLERAPAHPDPETPVLRITGVATFGSVEVQTVTKKRQ